MASSRAAPNVAAVLTMRPSLARALGVGLALAALPLAGLAALATARQLPWGDVGGLGLVLVALAILFAHIGLSDLFRLADPDDQPRLWPFTRLAALVEARQQAALLASRDEARSRQIDRAILDALPDPLLVLTGERALDYANDAARRALGPQIPAVLRHPTLRGAMDRVQTSQKTVESVELLLPVPVARDLHATVINLGGPTRDGRVALVFADRTQARAVERMRADFVANASHELRTPLASLIGFIETLQGPAADDLPAQQRFLVIMAEQASRMNRLIDDLLSLSRIELMEHLAPSERIDLYPLLERTLQLFAPRRLQAQVALEQDIAPNLPRIPADPDQIEQVLQNLLDNALKYGGPGGTIRLRLHEASGGRWPARPGIVLAISDDGPGIARAHLPRLTERFYRVDRGRARAEGGTGLGLAIVKHIVNRHRGQLAIDSEEGAGSTFSVWLPIAG